MRRNLPGGSLTGALAFFLVMPLFRAEGAMAVSSDSPFELTPVVAAKPSEYYESGACFTELVVPVDLNFDGRKDLLVKYFCNWNGESPPGPVLDAVMVYLTGEDGVLSVGNMEIFGADRLSLGGASRNYEIGDFNGDEIPDVAFAIAWEDGRPCTSVDCWDAQQTVVLSQGESYSIVRVGEPVYGHGIGAVENELGFDDLLTFRRNERGLLELHVLRWRSGRVEDVSTNYPNSVGLTLGGLDAKDGQLGGDLYVSAEAGGLNYFQRTSEGWLDSEEGAIEKVHVDTATYITWNGDEGNFLVSEIEGKFYLNAGIVDSCYLPESGGLPGYVVGKFTGYVLGEEYDPYGTYYEGDLDLINKLVFFELKQSGISLVATPLLEEFEADYFNFFTCKDFNNDGLIDIAVHDQTGSWRPYSGGAPRTYIRLPDGRFKHLNTDHFPKGIEDGSQMGLYADLDADGIQDLVIYNTGPEIAIRVHYGIFDMSLPVEKPFAPQIVGTDYGDGSISLAVNVSYNGGAAITGYDATCTDGTDVYIGASTSSPITISGLTNGVSYTCKVTATNSVGVSQSSIATAPITPEWVQSGLPIWLLYEASK